MRRVLVTTALALAALASAISAETAEAVIRAA